LGLPFILFAMVCEQKHLHGPNSSKANLVRYRFWRLAEMVFEMNIRRALAELTASGRNEFLQV
jgi:hypothetical protein